MELDEDGGLVVVAPGHWSRAHITGTLGQNVPRVERFLVRARQRHRAPLQYVDGEEHLFLGKYYPLTIRHVASGESLVEIRGDGLHIDSPVLQQEKSKSSLQNWYQCQARVVFRSSLHTIAGHAPWAPGLNIPLTLRRMKRTWGNCSSAGAIKLNTHLIKAPTQVLEAVIAHELCHLKEMNHGPAFYELLEKLNPQWRQARAMLRSQGFTYLLT